MRELIRLVKGQGSDNYFNSLIKQFMWYDRYDPDNNYYKTYSNTAKIEIKKAVGTKDDVEHFLFENRRVGKRKNLRTINMDSQFIDLPAELQELAEKMPDALDVLQMHDNQTDKILIKE